VACLCWRRAWNHLGRGLQPHPHDLRWADCVWANSVGPTETQDARGCAG
jgi:hypothetical protein